jgi:hypothetical protein
MDGSTTVFGMSGSEEEEKSFITLTPDVNLIKHFSYVTVDEAK